MNPLIQRLYRRRFTGDLDGWSPATADPRTPDRPEPGSGGAGPWIIGTQPAHGLYHRAHASGLVDWAAAFNGWLLWRWRAPRMTWTHRFVSPWNPILAGGLVLDDRRGFTTWWPEDSDDWTATAVLEGRKTAGGLRLSPHRRMREWVENARARGLLVEPIPHSFGAVTVAHGGTLASTFDLAGLAAEYERVLPGPAGVAAARDLWAYRDLPLLCAAIYHETYPLPVCGLALGYPPDVTAGVLMDRPHSSNHTLDAAELGAFCPRCDAADLETASAAAC